ncbi:metallophosphoesterase family protein [Macrococcus equipercicus]|uniref:DNA repair exonuclease n=1 Tax=Macrococcus equipercicus TaxID=69967 RepID=A0A9Q9F1G4_9STAP|nr:DNA repair exonuclease [Macrococcus equipercicus]KAA1039170.1 DNA repair exonuclease [Macrococcus equipercicus]UTH13346.1 DNA repair exonuclease [Macrococcus equipercicus]
MIKFIHCADLHLDAPFKLNYHVSDAIMEDIRRASFESFRRLVTDAIHQEVDFILIAGDLFDAKNQSLRTMIFLKEQFERLKDAHIFVYVIRGEADDIKYSRINWPSNVVVFGEQVETYEFITKEGNVVYIHGFSYKEHMNYHNKLEQYPTNQVDSSIHIGLLHGTFVKHQARDPLTEFSQEELNEKLYHYWALGHVHDRRLISELPHIHYPGNIQGTTMDESGKKGYLLVTGDHVSMDVVFVPTQFIRFEEAQIKLTDTGKNAIYQDVTDFKNDQRTNGKCIYKIELINNSETLVKQSQLDELLSLLQQYETHEQNFIWIDQLTLTQPHDGTTLHHEFDTASLNDSTLFNDALSPLYHDETFSRFLDNYETFSKEELLATGERKIKARMRDNE